MRCFDCLAQLSLLAGSKNDTLATGRGHSSMLVTLLIFFLSISVCFALEGRDPLRNIARQIERHKAIRMYNVLFPAEEFANVELKDGESLVEGFYQPTLSIAQATHRLEIAKTIKLCREQLRFDSEMKALQTSEQIPYLKSKLLELQVPEVESDIQTAQLQKFMASDITTLGQLEAKEQKLQIKQKDLESQRAKLKTDMQKIQLEEDKCLDTHRACTSAIQSQFGKNVEFVKEHPAMFTEKRFYIGDIYDQNKAIQAGFLMGDGQIVSIFDNFNYDLEASLRASCLNPQDADDQVLGPSDPNRSDHGNAVASIVSDAEIGIAPNSKFQVLSSDELFRGMEPAVNKQQFDFEMTDLNLSLDHAKTIAALLRSGTNEIFFKSGPNRRKIDISAFPKVLGNVVNFSLLLGDDPLKMRSTGDNSVFALGQVVLMTFYIHLILSGKLVVFSLGNEQMIVGTHDEAYATLRILATLFPRQFLIAGSVDSDGISISEFSNEPGFYALKEVTVVAQGGDKVIRNGDGIVTTDSGTSYAAPVVSAIAAILFSNFPSTSSKDVCEAILNGAVPIVIRTSSKRLHDVPVALFSVTSGKLQPGKYRTKVLSADSHEPKAKEIFVNKRMIEAGKAKYGQGRIDMYESLCCLKDELTSSKRYPRRRRGLQKKKKAKSRTHVIIQNMQANLQKLWTRFGRLERLNYRVLEVENLLKNLELRLSQTADDLEVIRLKGEVAKADHQHEINVLNKKEIALLRKMLADQAVSQAQLDDVSQEKVEADENLFLKQQFLKHKAVELFDEKLEINNEISRYTSILGSYDKDKLEMTRKNLLAKIEYNEGVLLSLIVKITAQKKRK